MNELIRYENAKRAIAEYRTVDDVKHFRDIAVAAEAYAKQANDHQLEYDAAAARVRAERKCGELLRDMEKAKNRPGPGRGKAGVSARPALTGTPKTLSDMGITKDQSSKWQKLAAVPEKEFEEAISHRDVKPTTSKLLKQVEPVPQERMDANVLWWWGRLCDMDKGKFDLPLEDVVEQMTEAMQRDALRIIPQLKKWVNSYE